MELVSPAGNIEKLRYVYEYGADTAYIGLKKFSLRVKADNFYENEYTEVASLKARYPQKRLFCALNISFHNNDIDNFLSDIDYFKHYPIDAFIVQDIGIVPILQKHFPGTHLHLSTQANCINREAVKMYQSLGFKRVVLGREASLAEIRQIKDVCPDMELEAFAHGAMCVAYSGRCLLSAYMTARSANSGFCSHACRWDYRVLEERNRAGEFFPIYEGEDYTEILSSKDLCMIDHLEDMKNAGVDAIKIEGRMKSLYYGALVTRAYRKALDALDGKIGAAEAKPFVDELYKTSHREFATGFYYNRADADKTTTGATDSEYELMGTIGREVSADEVFARAEKTAAEDKAALDAMNPNEKAAVLAARAEHHDEKRYPVRDDCCNQSPDISRDYSDKDGGESCGDTASAAIEQIRDPNGETRATARETPYTKKRRYFVYNSMNKLDSTTPLEFVGPDVIALREDSYELIDPETSLLRDWVSHGHECIISTTCDVQSGFIARCKTK